MNVVFWALDSKTVSHATVHAEPVGGGLLTVQQARRVCSTLFIPTGCSVGTSLPLWMLLFLLLVVPLLLLLLLLHVLG